MFGLDPRLVAVIAVAFLLLGVFNLYLGVKRLKQGPVVVWYKQTSILTGIEYILLMLVLVLRIGATYDWFRGGLSGLVVPTYTFILMLAAVVLCAMMYYGLRGARANRPVHPVTMVEEDEVEDEEGVAPEERAALQQKRRERRQKAAAARRRRAGRA